MAIHHSKFALWLRDLLADKKFRELRLRHHDDLGGRVPPLLVLDRATLLARSGQRIGKNAIALLAPLLMRDIRRAMEDASPNDAPDTLQRFVIDAYFGASDKPLRRFPMRCRTKAVPDTSSSPPSEPPIVNKFARSHLKNYLDELIRSRLDLDRIDLVTLTLTQAPGSLYAAPVYHELNHWSIPTWRELEKESRASLDGLVVQIIDLIQDSSASAFEVRGFFENAERPFSTHRLQRLDFEPSSASSTPPPPSPPPRPFASWFDTAFADAPNLRGVAERLLDMAATFFPPVAGALAQHTGEASRLVARLDFATVYRATRVLPMDRQREALDLFLALQALVPPPPRPNTDIENQMAHLFASLTPDQFHGMASALTPAQQVLALNLGWHFKRQYDEAQARANASARKETE